MLNDRDVTAEQDRVRRAIACLRPVAIVRINANQRRASILQQVLTSAVYKVTGGLRILSLTGSVWTWQCVELAACGDLLFGQFFSW